MSATTAPRTPIKAIGKEFVDLNELRVATDLEIQELLGVRYPAIEERVAMITQCLNDIFEREHTMSLDRLKTVSKRDARQFLRELPGMQPFVEAYVMLMAFDGTAFPHRPGNALPTSPRRKSSTREPPSPKPRNSSKTTSRARRFSISTSSCAGRRLSDGPRKKARS